MQTYNELMAKIIAMVTPTDVPVSFNTALEKMAYYGQVGDFFGGFWGTIIGVVTLIVVFATWSSTKKIDERSKVYQVFAEILRTHEEIVTSLRLGNLSGREALSEILSEFYLAYAELDSKNVKGKQQGSTVTLALETRINAAFLLMFYGAHPATVKLLEDLVPELDASDLCRNIAARKRSRFLKEINTELGQLLGDRSPEQELWKVEVSECFPIAKTVPIPADRHILIGVLNRARLNPHKKFNKRNVVKFIEEFETSTELGGHQNRLSHYFRNLYSAFMFIEGQSLSTKEKESLSIVLRSKLSNYEQALVALHALSEEGASWFTSGLLAKYMPIKNIPKHFFSFDPAFDLKEKFPEICFDWEEKR